MQSKQSRRALLRTLSSAAAAAAIGRRTASAEAAPPETTRVRLAKVAGICIAPFESVVLVHEHLLGTGEDIEVLGVLVAVKGHGHPRR